MCQKEFVWKLYWMIPVCLPEEVFQACSKESRPEVDKEFSGVIMYPIQLYYVLQSTRRRGKVMHG